MVEREASQRKRRRLQLRCFDEFQKKLGAPTGSPETLFWDSCSRGFEQCFKGFSTHSELGCSEDRCCFLCFPSYGNSNLQGWRGSGVRGAHGAADGRRPNDRMGPASGGGRKSASIEGIKDIIAVASGKGGVGKSTTAGL